MNAAMNPFGLFFQALVQRYSVVGPAGNEAAMGRHLA